MNVPPETSVLVVGEALIDIVETAEQRVEHVGGSPANVALGLGRRGIPVTLLTHLAPDARGRRIVKHLEHSGVRVAAESMTARATSTALARIGADGQATYEFHLDWGAVRPPEDLAPTVVHTGSVGAFLEPGAESVRELLRTTTAREITFDPNIRPALVGSHGSAFGAFEQTARLATVVKMSDEDAEWLYPGVPVDDVIRRVLELGPRLVAITLGAKGAIVANADHLVRNAGESVDAVDTIGAGDTFMASLIAAVFEGGSHRLRRDALERIGRDATRAAAITVARAGADLPWTHELE